MKEFVAISKTETRWRLFEHQPVSIGLLGGKIEAEKDDFLSQLALKRREELLGVTGGIEVPDRIASPALSSTALSTTVLSTTDLATAAVLEWLISNRILPEARLSESVTATGE